MIYKRKNRASEKGNIFFTLFGAVAIVGVLGASIMATMRGPLKTMVNVNRRAQAEAQMQLSAKLALYEASEQASSGDCDADTFVEPVPWKDAAGDGPDGVAGSEGGGFLPDSFGVTKLDPWGTAYGYCVWDAGTVADDAACGGAGQLRLPGNGLADQNYTSIAMISAGPDKTFQTGCVSHPTADNNSDGDLADVGDDELVAKAGGSDDLIFEYTYDDARGVTGGLWSLMAGDPDTATIDKELEVAHEARFTGGIDMTTSSAALQLGAASMMLPNETTLATCNLANVNLVRINTVTDPDTIEICDDASDSGAGAFTWQSVAAGASVGLWRDDGPGAGTGEIYYNSGFAGIGTNDPDDMLDVVGVIGLTENLEMSNTKSVVWTSGAAITEAGGGLQLNANGGTGVELTLGATTASFIADTTITGSTDTNAADALTVEASDGDDIFVVQNDGSVGINTASPDDALSVVGNIDTTTHYKIDNNVVLRSDTLMADTILVGNAAGAATTGDDNTILGAGAAATLVAGARNIVVGNAVNVPAAGTNDYLNIGNSIFGDLANKRVGIGFANAFDVSAFDETLEVNGDMDVVNIDASGDITVDDVLASGIVSADDVFFSNELRYGTVGVSVVLGPPSECDPDEKLEWTDAGGWTCENDLQGGSGGAGQNLEEVLIVGNDAGGENAVDLGGVAIGSGTLSTGGTQDLELDVTGDIGATNYCDADGNNCFTAATVGTVPADSLDYDDFEDAMDLDASTTITADNAEILSIINTGTANSFVVWDQAADATPFVIDPTGDVGIGDPTPDGTLLLDVEGQIGAVEYCDQDGNNCFDFTDIAAAAAPALSDILDADAINSIDSLDFAQTWAWNTLAGTNALTLSTNSTAAAGNAQTLLNISSSGANATATQTTYGARITNTHTGGTSTNVGLSLSASGANNNYALIVPNGRVGVGTSTPLQDLDVQTKMRMDVGGTHAAISNGIELETQNVIAGNIYSDFFDADLTQRGIAYRSANTYHTQFISGDDFFFRNNALAPLMSIMDTGNVNIGTVTSTTGATLKVAGTDSIMMPVGTVANRPAGAGGMIRYNTDPTPNDRLEYYDTQTSTWIQLAGTGAGAGLYIDDLLDAMTDYVTDHNMRLGSNTAMTAGAANNLFIGESAGTAGTANSDHNIAIGYTALNDLTDGKANIAMGVGALTANTTGEDNIGIGYNAGSTLIDTYQNVAIGYSALSIGATGDNNIAIGAAALQNNTADNNTAVGRHALQTNTSGTRNTGVGSSVLNASDTVDDNTGFGYNALLLATGGTNTAVGSLAGNSITTGTGNIVLGYNVDTSAAGASNELNIGNTIYGDLANDLITIGSATHTTGANLKVAGTNSIMVPVGTVAQRPAGAAGMFRYNTDPATNDRVEYYDAESATWVQLAGTGASSSIYINDLLDAVKDTTAQHNMVLGTELTMTAGAIENLFIGESAGTAGTSNAADRNLAIGYQSLDALTTGNSNLGIGVRTLSAITDGVENVAIGYESNATGTSTQASVVVGYSSNAGDSSVAVGRSANAYNGGVAVGRGAGRDATGGIRNVAIGYMSLWANNTTGDDNVAIGGGAVSGALGSTSGDNNIGIGYQAGNDISSGNSNIMIGYDVDAPSATGDSQLNIGGTIFGDMANDRIRIGGSGAVGAGPLIAAAPATQTIAATNTITANACGTVKAIDSAGAVTTNTTDTFTTPAAAYNGCCMDVVNVGSNNITLDANANFVTGNGSDVTLTGGDTIRVCGTATTWYQSEDKVTMAPGSIFIDDLGDAIKDTTAQHNMVLGTELTMTAGAVNNLFIGESAGTAGGSNLADNNVGIGYTALDALTDGSDNIAIGFAALTADTTGGQNVAIGVNALSANTIGGINVAVGYGALAANDGGANIAVGGLAGNSNTSGNGNTFLGRRAGALNTVADASVAVGYQALRYFDPGVGSAHNVAVGTDALLGVNGSSNGVRNTALGGAAGNSITTGTDNILIGYDADTPAATTTYHLNIGDSIFGDLANDRIRIGGSGAVSAGPFIAAPPATQAIAATNTITANACGTVKQIMVGTVGVNDGDVTTSTTDTFTTPAAAYAGCCMDVINVETGTDDITLDANANFLTGNGGNVTLAPGKSVRICGNGSAWYQDAPTSALSASTVPLSGLTDATAINTIANANYAQTWNWDTLTTETALALASSSMTSGSLLNVASTNAAAVTGSAINVANATTGAGYGIQSTMSGASNTGYAGYFNNSGGGATLSYGVLGTTASTTNGRGVQGSITGASNTGFGVRGVNSGVTNTGHAGYFTNTGGGTGLLATTNGTGAVSGVNASITGASNVGYAGLFVNSGGGAVTNYGIFSTTDATGAAAGIRTSITGAANTGYGLYTLNASTSGWALWANGNTYVENGTLIVEPPAAEAIAAAGTITANGCGTIKQIMTGTVGVDDGDVTTNTTNTFTAPAAAYAGCCMDVINVETGTDDIILDVNANFLTGSGSNITLSPGKAVRVCGNGSTWFQDAPTSALSASNVPLSGLTVATATNSIDNTLYAQTWDWSTISTETALALTASGTTLTSGKLLNVTSASTGFTGTMANFDLTGSNAANTGTVLKSSITGALSTGTPLMVTNLGAGLSMRVNDDTGDTDTSPFVVDASGQVGVGTASPTTNLTINRNASGTMPTVSANSALHIVSADTGPAKIDLDSFGGNPVIIARRAQGTSALPTATTNGLVLLSLTAQGYGDTGYGGGGALQFYTNEDWTDAAHGSFAIISTTPIGTTTSETRMMIGNAGQVDIYGTEATDSAILLDADQGDDAADSWFIKSVASGNSLTISNDSTKYLDLNATQKLVITPPATEAIAAAGTITANACGSIKPVMVGTVGVDDGDITTDTTNTFTAPAAANAGCCMEIVNVETGTDDITLDTNANFITGLGTNITITAGDGVKVCSNGSAWYQGAAVSSLSASVSPESIPITDLTDAVTDYANNNMRMGNNTGMFAGATGNLFIGETAGTAGTSNAADDNIAIGDQALDALTIGGANVALGVRALTDNTTGGGNVAIGWTAMDDNIDGGWNVAIGTGAMYSNVSGYGQVAIGYEALNTATAASGNTAVGYAALKDNLDTGINNTALGYQALTDNTTGFQNVAVGFQSMQLHTANSYNTALGVYALQNNAGDNNTAVGRGSLRANLAGAGNTGVGMGSLRNSDTGSNNVAVGYDALLGNTDGSGSTAIGKGALTALTTGGTQNTALGYLAGDSLTTGDGNIMIGYDVDASGATVNSELNIGGTIFGDMANDNIRIGGSGAVGAGPLLVQPPATQAIAAAGTITANACGSIKTVMVGTVGVDDGDITTNTTNTFTAPAAANAGCCMEIVNVETGTDDITLDTNANFITGLGTNITISAGDAVKVCSNGSAWYQGAAVSSLSASVTPESIPINDLSDALKDTGADHNMRLGENTAMFAGAAGNLFIGEAAGTAGTSNAADNNLAIGYTALDALSTGYSNLAIGTNALGATNVGYSNVAIGLNTMAANVVGYRNTAVGEGAMGGGGNTAENVAVGQGALGSANDGNYNVALGRHAMNSTSSGDMNIAIGHSALLVNTTSSGQIAIGHQALTAAVTATGNTAIGYLSMSANTANNNTALGYNTLATNVGGGANTAIGFNALAISNDNNASHNTAIGNRALEDNTTGFQLTAIGSNALRNNTTGNLNVAVGTSTMDANLNGYGNVAIGDGAMILSTDGVGNVALGGGAGDNMTSADNSIIIGYNVDAMSATANSQLNIGDSIFGDIANDNIRIGGSGAVGAGPFIANPPATEVIAGAATITANACGTIKPISAGSSVTTNTTDTFTAPAAAYNGCCMDVINVDNADTITLDSNANFITGTGSDVALAPGKAIRVCGTTTTWYQDAPTSAASAGSVALSGIANAAGNNTTTNASNNQIWNWQLSGDEHAFTIGETAASSGGTNQILLVAKTLATSTAVPFAIENLGDNVSFAVSDVAADTTPFVIDANGNVGISTVTPHGALELGGDGDSAVGAASLTLGRGGDIGFNSYEAGGPVDRYLYTSGSAFKFWQDTGNDVLVFKAGGSGTAGNDITYANAMTIGTTGNVRIGGSGAVPTGPFLVEPPATEVIAGAATITANACGTIKPISAASSVTTNTTNTFTAPAAANAGCCMIITNVDTADTITLDVNANFITGAGTDIAVGPGDGVQVCSNGTTWYQGNALSSLASSGSSIDGLSDAVADYVTDHNMRLGSNTAMTAGASGNVFIGDGAGTAGTTNAADNNIAIGYAPLDSLTTGTRNLAIGFSALSAVSTTNDNIGIGYNTQLAATGGNNISIGSNSMGGGALTGSNNVGLGSNTLENTTGSDDSTAIGYMAMRQNTTGDYNTAVGSSSLYNNKAKRYSTAVGAYAMYYADDSTVIADTNNTAVGYSALMGSTTAANNIGTGNTALGAYAIDAITSGSANTGLGVHALGATTSGGTNVAVGYQALMTNVNDNDNTAIGYNALAYATATGNTALGYSALSGATMGGNNVGIGKNTGTSMNNATAANNILVGYQAGNSITTGGTNIIIGYDADTPAATTSSHLNIGDSIFGDLANDNIRIGGSGAVSAGPLLVQPPATQAIAAAGTITANACGSIKPVMVGTVGVDDGDVTTDTTNTFTAPAAANAGCCMEIVNVETGTDDITLDTNANFITGLGTNITIAAGDAVKVCSNGSAWYQGAAVSSLSASVTPESIPINDLSDALKDTGADHNMRLGVNTAITAGAANNLFIGESAGSAGTTNAMDNNLAIGYTALDSLTTGSQNTAIGTNALTALTTATANIAIGYNTLAATTGDSNVAIGPTALDSNVGGYENIAIGHEALTANTNGYSNIAIGYRANYTSGGSGAQNVSIGTNAARNQGGTGAVAIGNAALVSGSADNVVGIGVSALANVTGANNIAIGYQAGDLLTTGASNIIIGYDADAPANNTSSFLNIGDSLFGDLANDRIRIGGSGAVGAGPLLVQPPANEAIAAAGTITANACGSIKPLMVGTVGVDDGDVTTNTTNTFTAPAAGNAGCCMEIVNVETGTDDITLDTNANFVTGVGTNVTLSAGDAVKVCSNGSAWYQGAAVSSLSVSAGSVALSGITDATGANSLTANGDHAQSWKWTLTTAAKSAMEFGEQVAATNGTTAQSIVKMSTLATSTAMPLWISNFGTKNSLQIDDVSGDTSPFTIDASGNVSMAIDASFYFGSANVFDYGSSALNIRSPSGNGMNFYNSGNLNMSMANTGLFGVGYNLTPLAQLHSRPNSDTNSSILEALRLDNMDGNSAGVDGIGSAMTFFAETETDGTYKEFARIAGVADDAANASRDGSLRLYTVGPNGASGAASTERMRIDSSGNVGIGKTPASYRLDVDITGAGGNMLQFMEGASTWATLTSASGHAIMTLKSGAGSSNVILRTDGDSYMYYDLALGPVTSAAAKLHVSEEDTTGNSVLEVLRLEHIDGDSAGSANIGTAMTFWNETATAGTSRESGRISSVFTTATDASKVGELKFYTTSGAAAGTSLEIANMESTRKFVVIPPAVETIAGAATITANACGTIKQIQSTGNVTTDTTNTFTAPAAANSGCCMIITNIDTADTITLDVNANFITGAGTDIAVGPGDGVQVCSNGTTWYQGNALSSLASAGSSIDGLSDATYDTGADKNMRLGSNTAMTAGAANNLFIGESAGTAGTTNAADRNIAIGYQALDALTTGNSNTAVGVQALSANTAGMRNTGIGYGALASVVGVDIDNGSQNTAVGYTAGSSLTGGAANTMVGHLAMDGGTGSGNVAVGSNTLRGATGNDNVSVGYGSMDDAVGVSSNVAVGAFTLALIGDGSGHVAVGSGALSGALTGSEDNVALGFQAGNSITTGDLNIMIGYDVDASVATANNELNIGNAIYGTGIHGGTVLIGINNSAPETTLEVTGSVCVSDATGDTCTGAAAGAIMADGAVTANAFDVAERYAADTDIKPGTIVALDGKRHLYIHEASAKPTTPVLGIVSTDPGLVLGWENNEAFKSAPHVVLVALAGRVPLKVTGENGSIKIGDRVALSATVPGHGTKAAKDTGSLVGIALNNFNAADKNARGILEVFVDTKDIADVRELRSELDTLKADNADLQKTLASVADDIKGLKAYTGYGVSKAEITMAMLAAMALAAAAFAAGTAVRNRRKQ